MGERCFCRVRKGLENRELQRPSRALKAFIIIEPARQQDGRPAGGATDSQQSRRALDEESTCVLAMRGVLYCDSFVIQRRSRERTKQRCNGTF